MASKEKPVNPHKRYISRLSELAKRDPQIGALRPREEVRDVACNPTLSYDRVIATFLHGYARRPALGQRKYTVVYDNIARKNIRKYLPAFETITYQAFHDSIKALSMAWRTHPTCQVHRDEFVCIMGFASTEYAIIDTACVYAKAVTVPLSRSTSDTDLKEILKKVTPVLIASRISDLELSVDQALQQASIKSILVFNYNKEVEEEEEIVAHVMAKLHSANSHISLVFLNELIAYGKKQRFTFLPVVKGENEKLAIIIHSSGSTGKPKGACVSRKAMINNWKGRGAGLAKVGIILAPFNHFMGRGIMYAALNVGGTAFFTLKEDLSTLFEDIRIVRPTSISFFPRIMEMIYQHFQNEVSKRLKSQLESRDTIEATVKAEMKSSYLGDRFLFATVGSAPTSPHVKQFMIDCFDIFLMEGYGNTEAGSGSLAVEGKVNRRAVIDYYLRDVPELGYFKTDKPYPRGEFCVKTRFGIKEYYKQPEATAGLLDENGYNYTGDIVEERGPDHIVIIDRRKDVIKLSQAEYVAVGPLGKLFEGGSSLIHQIYVYGNSYRSYLLAVIVPEMELVHQLYGKDVSESQLKQYIRQEIIKVGQKEELKGFEIPRDFLLEYEKFSYENGLLSSVRKYLRPAIKRKYGNALEALYSKHDEAQKEGVSHSLEIEQAKNTVQILKSLLAYQLGMPEEELADGVPFLELGGDSLGAVEYSLHIEDKLGISLGADSILSPKGSFHAWAKQIEDVQNPKTAKRSFETVHGKGSKVIEAKDLLLEKFIPTRILQKAPSLPYAKDEDKTVLLTGANGFLGHILCLKCLEILSQKGGKLICIIRAESNEAAKRRLERAFSALDPALEHLFTKLSVETLEVLAGDISEAKLGLKDEDFDRLATETSRIIHAAALVNHRLSYSHVFGPNVVGTAEIIRLAITHKKKPIDFISTIGVNKYLKKDQGNHEYSPLKDQVPLTGQYGNGYSISKWASEHLLIKAYQALGISINVFRCNMILADQKYQGQINEKDILTRMLYSIIQTGIAPLSFYPKTSHSHAHYNGIPVDILSDAIVRLTHHSSGSYTTYNAHNYLKDNISLDTFVEWIESAGYKIKRIPNYQTWFEQMKSRLTALTEDQQRYSALPVMEAYNREQNPRQIIEDCTHFKNLIRDLYPSDDLPQLSEKYFHKCLKDMQVRGLIEAPNRKA